jgi:dipeptidase E
MSYVVAIGGGEIGRGKTKPIDRHFISLAGVPTPKVLYLGTACEDERRDRRKFARCYRSLGAVVSVLAFNGSKPPSDDEMDEKFGEADAIYAGGGNTYTLLDKWQDAGIDKRLIGRVATGVVVGGLSAGANCWFQYASSSSPRPGATEDEGYTVAHGLSVIPGTMASPHFATEHQQREGVLVDHLATLTNVRGLAIDDWAAYVARIDTPGIVSQEYAISVNPIYGVNAYTLDEDGSLQTTRIPNSPTPARV